MVVLRCTRELLRRLKQPRIEPGHAATTRLGDWYIALLHIGPRQYLLAVSERTRLPVLLPAGDARALATPLRAAGARVLLALGVPDADVAAECSEMSTASFGPTRSRSLLGTVNDYTFAARIPLEDQPGIALDDVALWLAETPIMAPFKGASASDETRRAFGLAPRPPARHTHGAAQAGSEARLAGWLEDSGAIGVALREAARDARRFHKAMGNPMATWADGTVVWVRPEDIRIDDDADGH